MVGIEFWKMNGSGNDFILIDNRQGVILEGEMGPLVKQACRRRESVGADGVIFIHKSDECDFGWHYFNADGGEVEMCGNGGRCVARFAYLKGIAGPKMTFETLVGPVSAEVHGRTVKVLMPTPQDLRMDLDLGDHPEWENVDFINSGVPHVVVCVGSLSHYPVVEQGRLIRHHGLFAPQGTNANFVKVTGPSQLTVRTYERGVEDETLACGTGAIASALIAAKRDLVDSPVTVKTQGGEELLIHFERRGDSFSQVWLEGNTTIVYEARLNKEAV
jgi:diaminopimelate epimerase